MQKIIIGWTGSLLLPIPTALAQPPVPSVDTSWFPFVIVVLVCLVALVGLGAVKKASSAGAWSLQDALSDVAELTDANGNTVKVMRASSSRMIAFLGSIVILALFIGFGSVVLFRYAKAGNMPYAAVR